MTQVNVKYNPYRLKTDIEVNGKPLSDDSELQKETKDKRLQEWLDDFPEKIISETNSTHLDVTFCGMTLDWNDFQSTMEDAKEEGLIKELKLHFNHGKDDDDVTETIIDVFEELNKGPFDDFRSPQLVKAFKNVCNSVFPINVIATMSSGKSTLINALLEQRLMPSKNEACTATITEILDNDINKYVAVVYDKNGAKIRDIDELTYEIMDELNSDKNVSNIKVEGNIPFIDAKSMALCLVDTPGPNNSQNQEHKNTTYRAINSDSNNLILYILNGTQLATNDDASLLGYIAEQMKKGGKQARDRFLFVINKMDQLDPENESIENTIKNAKKYLSRYGIDNPQIFPCSAYAALNIKTILKDVDVDNLTRAEEKKLSKAARDTLSMIDSFVDYDDMHLEKYSTLSPSAQESIERRLADAEENNDTKELALIHCGIYSIEEAITEYVKKYAKTKKVKDLVESFMEVLNSTKVLENARTQVATNEQAAKECAQRAEAIKKKIENGKEAQKFKDEINSLNPMDKICSAIDNCRKSANENVVKIFRNYGEIIDNREEAKRLIKLFADDSSDEMAKLSADIEEIIDKEIRETGTNMLERYTQKIVAFDESLGESSLDFSTLDLIKGALSNMVESRNELATDDFATQQIDDLGEVTYEDKTYYEKTGQEEEQVLVGTHKEKIGERKIVTGHHKEKVGTREVKNSDRKWFQFWKKRYVTEDVYEDVEDYGTEDVFEEVQDFETVIRDVFEERHETIEHYSVKVAEIQKGLMSQFRYDVDNGVKASEEYAEQQVDDLKEQFKDKAEEVDELIKQKYTQLTEYSRDENKAKEELEKTKKNLDWINSCTERINKALDM